MKKIVLIRHAKSSWKDTSLSDFDRPLNNRGLMNAPFMAAQIKKRRITPDLILSSSAKRTSKTAKIFAVTLEYTNEIIFLDSLYLASSSTILQMIRKLDEIYKNVLIVCHNPGITDLANYLCKNYFDNIPTTGIVGFSFKEEWRKIETNNCSLLFFEYPKKY